MRVWDVSTGGCEAVYRSTDRHASPSPIAYGAAGESVCVLGSEGLRILRASNLSILAEFPVDGDRFGRCTSAAQVMDRFLVTGTSSGEILFHDLVGHAQAARIDPGDQGPIGALAVSPHGTVLASSETSFEEGRGDLPIRLWDISTHVLIREIPAHLCRGRLLGFSADGRHLIASDTAAT